MLTDGDVDNSDNIIRFVRKNRTASIRFYSLGIGNGCSKHLIEEVAE